MQRPETRYPDGKGEIELPADNLTGQTNCTRAASNKTQVGCSGSLNDWANVIEMNPKARWAG